MTLEFNIVNLFLAMLVVGALSFGGGLGAITIIKDIAVTNAWLGEDSFANLVTFTQYNPYVSGLSAATYLGSELGLAGVAAAVVGITLPGIVAFLIIWKLGVKFYGDRRFSNSVRYVNLIALGAVFSVMAMYVFAIFGLDPIVYVAVAGVAAFFNMRFDVSPAIIIGAGAVIGLIWRAGV